ncbi:hypothetical protein RFI_23788 [Reticulomyxa filosa]|uniref:Uncharacterized protein n=1 Tax=Reticulomyxa filosa TaxID=46433 RepID=X6MJF8_RETFI|nr:hypothetical protein RFI_23788 [Reticulomyxa filosa]|eukprot:ETO13577.1 hypothetical protein RFI_23788 [Reticulomyxa filosa]
MEANSEQGNISLTQESEIRSFTSKCDLDDISEKENAEEKTAENATKFQSLKNKDSDTLPKLTSSLFLFEISQNVAISSGQKQKFTQQEKNRFRKKQRKMKQKLVKKKSAIFILLLHLRRREAKILSGTYNKNENYLSRQQLRDKKKAEDTAALERIKSAVEYLENQDNRSNSTSNDIVLQIAIDLSYTECYQNERDYWMVIRQLCFAWKSNKLSMHPAVIHVLAYSSSWMPYFEQQVSSFFLIFAVFID